MADQEKVVVVGMADVLVHNSAWHNISISQGITTLRKETCVVSLLSNDESDPWVVIGFDVSARSFKRNNLFLQNFRKLAFTNAIPEWTKRQARALNSSILM